MRNMRNIRRIKALEGTRRPGDLGEDVKEKQYKILDYKYRFRHLIDDMYDAFYAEDDESVAEYILKMDDIIDALDDLDF